MNKKKIKHFRQDGLFDMYYCLEYNGPLKDSVLNNICSAAGVRASVGATLFPRDEALAISNLISILENNIDEKN